MNEKNCLSLKKNESLWLNILGIASKRFKRSIEHWAFLKDEWIWLNIKPILKDERTWLTIEPMMDKFVLKYKEFHSNKFLHSLKKN